MGPDMIMEWYRNLLGRLSKWRIKKFKIGRFLAEPLGLCIICNSHWVAFIIFYFNYSKFQIFDSPKIMFECMAIAVSGISTLLWFGYNFVKSKI
jgi:hypothetical protein